MTSVDFGQKKFVIQNAPVNSGSGRNINASYHGNVFCSWPPPLGGRFAKGQSATQFVGAGTTKTRDLVCPDPKMLVDQVVFELTQDSYGL